MTTTQIFYASSATKTINQAEIDKILAKAREFNSQHSITGILLFHSGIFLQLLEGEKSILDSLYAKIAGDKRHANVIKIFEISGNERIFKDWSMGYRELGTIDIKMVNEILSWNSLILGNPNIDNALILRMLERFRVKAAA